MTAPDHTRKPFRNHVYPWMPRRGLSALPLSPDGFDLRVRLHGRGEQ